MKGIFVSFLYKLNQPLVYAVLINALFFVS